MFYSHVRESLGDAYCLRESYQAALNSFNRALSLGAHPLYPKYRIGVVYQVREILYTSMKEVEMEMNLNLNLILFSEIRRA
jgi:hypothetical protein